MSDAQGVSEQSDTAPLAPKPSVAAETRRSHSGRWIRLLATVGALVFAYAVWLPWAAIAAALGERQSPPELVDPTIAFTSHLVNLGSLAPTSFEVAAFSVLGLLLAPLLWRPADSLLGAIATHIFGLWLIFATVFVIAFGISPLVSGTPQPVLTGVLANATITGHLALGFWVAAAALIPMWIAVIALLIVEWRRHAFWHLPGNDADTPGRSYSFRRQRAQPGSHRLGLRIPDGGLGDGQLYARRRCSSAVPRALPSGSLFAGLQATSGAVIASASDPGMLLFLDPNIARNAIGILLGRRAALIFLGVWLARGTNLLHLDNPLARAGGRARRRRERILASAPSSPICPRAGLYGLPTREEDAGGAGAGGSGGLGARMIGRMGSPCSASQATRRRRTPPRSPVVSLGGRRAVNDKPLPGLCFI